MTEYGFFIDPSRCIGCKACENACAECETHRGYPMIQVDFLDRANSIATVPTVCMHCDNPTCAQVCPADAIKKTEDGVVQSSLKPRCVACSNCVLGCPFGVPKMMSRLDQMMKCDMCYDRTSVGKRPMCATVCPSQALAFVPLDQIKRERRLKPTNIFHFGNQKVTTKVFMMVSDEVDDISIDVVDYMWEQDQTKDQSNDGTQRM
jgi:Fe-S-cluster-containing dehydrogenase component